MPARRLSRVLVAFAAGCIIGLLFGHFDRLGGLATPTVQAEPTKALLPELATLRADVERLKAVVPDQAHAMKDVDYHFTNLWFAGEAENWPLADFYWKETLSHIKWAVRIIPVRKDNAGREIKLEEILQAIEMTQSMQMGDVIKESKREKFEPTYRAVIEGCYLCHKASDKQYLRLKVPEHPATSIINFDPKATWPN